MPVEFIPINNYSDGTFRARKSVKTGYSNGIVLAWMPNPEINESAFF